MEAGCVDILCEFQVAVLLRVHHIIEDLTLDVLKLRQIDGVGDNFDHLKESLLHFYHPLVHHVKLQPIVEVRNTITQQRSDLKFGLGVGVG